MVCIVVAVLVISLLILDKGGIYYATEEAEKSRKVSMMALAQIVIHCTWFAATNQSCMSIDGSDGSVIMGNKCQGCGSVKMVCTSFSCESRSLFCPEVFQWQVESPLSCYD